MMLLKAAVWPGNAGGTLGPLLKVRPNVKAEGGTPSGQPAEPGLSEVEGMPALLTSRLLKNSFRRSSVPRRLKPLLILRHLRRGSKPRPFKTEPLGEFFSSLLENEEHE
jgi:hypothetical protein